MSLRDSKTQRKKAIFSLFIKAAFAYCLERKIHILFIWQLFNIIFLSTRGFQIKNVICISILYTQSYIMTKLEQNNCRKCRFPFSWKFYFSFCTELRAYCNFEFRYFTEPICTSLHWSWCCFIADTNLLLAEIKKGKSIKRTAWHLQPRKLSNANIRTGPRIGVKTTHLHLVVNLRMRGAIPPLFLAWCLKAFI
jgi:hypothetical protein